MLIANFMFNFQVGNACCSYKAFDWNANFVCVMWGV